jgi:hypothetical protein
MKKLMGITLLITLAAMSVTSYAGAIDFENVVPGDDYIGLYSDAAHSVCSHNASGYFDFYYYVFAKAGTEGMAAVEFKIVFPSLVYDSGSLTLNADINLTLGDISTDWSATFAVCQRDWVQIYRQRVYCDTSIESNGVIQIDRGDESNYLGLSTCDMMDSEFTVLNHMFINLPCESADYIPPVISTIDALSESSMEIGFSEPVDSVTAVNLANFAVFETSNQSIPLQVLEASLTNAWTVRLTMGSPFEPAVSYTILVSNVRDMAGNQIVDGRCVKILIPLAITHEPISCGVPGNNVSASWSASDPAFSVASTCLYYRRAGAASWIEQCVNNPINPVVVTIPGADMGDEGVEYYITATNGIGLTVYHGSADIPHFVPACPPVTCDRPIISLLGYHSIEYVNPIWQVDVEVFNSGPGIARNVIATMNTDVSWLVIPDPVCAYGNIAQWQSSLGGTDSYSFDLINNPGGSFNVWFDVTYEDSCGNQYRVRLDPEFGIDSEHVGTPEAITAYHLAQNYPNPFNPITTIDYQIPIRSRVSLKIFDVSGKLVRTLVDEYEGVGSHVALWDGKDGSGKAVASSIYFYELRAGDYRQTKRMVLLR